MCDPNGNKKRDGPTMLHILLSTMDPSMAISIEAQRTKIKQCKLQAFDNHVPNMITFIEKHYKIIKDNGFNYADETYHHHIIQALSSGSNATFNEYI